MPKKSGQMETWHICKRPTFLCGAVCEKTGLPATCPQCKLKRGVKYQVSCILCILKYIKYVFTSAFVHDCTDPFLTQRSYQNMPFFLDIKLFTWDSRRTAPARIAGEVRPRILLLIPISLPIHANPWDENAMKPTKSRTRSSKLSSPSWFSRSHFVSFL